MYPEYRKREGRFLRGAIVFGGSLVGLVAIGLFMSGVLGGGGEESTPATAARAPESPLPVLEFPATVAPAAADTVPEEASGSPRMRTSNVSYREAEAEYQAGRYQEALDLFTVYTGEHPGNAWGHYMYGLSAWKTGNLDDAKTGFRTALTLDPSHLKSRNNLTRVLLDENRPGEALPVIEEAVSGHPESGEAHRLLGRVYHNLGRTENALRAYREAVERDSGDVWAMNNMGLLLIEAGRFEEALPPLARATRLASAEPVFQNNLGIALERTGHYTEAADAFRAGLAGDDTNGKLMANLERVQALRESPGLEPVDLGDLASRFETGLLPTEPELSQTAPAGEPASGAAGADAPPAVLPEDRP